MAMPTREKKTQLRIHPDLAKALGIVARTDGVPGYELLEDIVLSWLLENRPEIKSRLAHVIFEVNEKRVKRRFDTSQEIPKPLD
jgi:hypothetical protein